MSTPKLTTAQIKQFLSDEYLKCATDPVHFMKNYCYIQHPQKGKILFKLYPFQDKTLVQFKKHRYNMVLKSRQLGISTLVAGYALWLMLFHEDKNVLVIAINQMVAKNLVTKVRVMHDMLPGWIRSKTIEDNKMSLRFPNGSQIKAIAATESAGRSESLSLLVIDEAAFISNIESIWIASQQTLATGGEAIVLSTPNGVGNWFHKTWVDSEAGDNDFNTIKLKWNLHPDRDQSWRDKQTELLGADGAAAECDADFISSGNTVVHPSILKWYLDNIVEEPIEKRGPENGLWVWEKPDYTKSYMISVDVARGDATDYSAFHILEIDSLRQIAEFKAHITTTDLGHMLVNTATEYNNALLVIENASIGWAVIQTVIDRGYQNIYYSQKTNQFQDQHTQLYKGLDLKLQMDMTPGFTNSSKTRPLLIEKLCEYTREKEVLIKSKRLIDELFVFIWHNGKAQARQSYNDDLVLSYSIGLWTRDTAIKLRSDGMDLQRSILKNISVQRNNQIYNSNGQRQGPGSETWKMPGGQGESEDLTWLL